MRRSVPWRCNPDGTALNKKKNPSPLRLGFLHFNPVVLRPARHRMALVGSGIFYNMARIHFLRVMSRAALHLLLPHNDHIEASSSHSFQLSLIILFAIRNDFSC